MFKSRPPEGESDEESEMETEEEEEENDENSEDGNSKNGKDEDDTSDEDDQEILEDEEEDEEEEESEKRKKSSYLMDIIMDEDWTGNLETDTKNFKDIFQRFVVGLPFTKTKLFQNFNDDFLASKDSMEEESEEDGVNKKIKAIEEEAFNKTFADFERRIQDNILRIYKDNDIEETNSEEDNNNNEG